MTCLLTDWSAEFYQYDEHGRVRSVYGEECSDVLTAQRAFCDFVRTAVARAEAGMARLYCWGNTPFAVEADVEEAGTVKVRSVYNPWPTRKVAA